MSFPRKPCLNDPNSFCFICGKFSLQKQRKKITEFVKTVYREYFGIPLVKRNKYWVKKNKILQNFNRLGVNMSMHFLHSHLDRFPQNLGDYSEEQGERFHQDIRIMEERYQGRWDSHMMADYCWTLKRDCPDKVNKRKPQRKSFS
ncbi:hypothetical protein PYW07_003996 [Mythimna separata]|uniref:Uncharacterized protein n=1 Tax=Mythimna separata TaxID=271217 RepID=A0AAD7YNW1_MYTSE|nr:hypothetical protein PYW07_003996 [Mythimna separata]